MSKPNDQKAEFIRELAQYLAGRQVELSIASSMGSVHGEQWMKLRTATPLRGYPTVDEAEQELAEFLR